MPTDALNAGTSSSERTQPRASVGATRCRACLQGKSSYTVSCNLPVQGACADASMLALAAIDELLFEHGIDGGPVAWLHDEIVLEVPIEHAVKAAELLLVRAMREPSPKRSPARP